MYVGTLCGSCPAHVILKEAIGGKQNPQKNKTYARDETFAPDTSERDKNQFTPTGKQNI